MMGQRCACFWRIRMEFDFYWHFDRCIFYRINNWKWLRNSLTKNFKHTVSPKILFQTNISSTSHAPAVNCSKMSSIFYRAALLLKQKRKVTTLIRRQRWISKVHKLTPTTFSRWNRGPKRGAWEGTNFPSVTENCFLMGLLKCNIEPRLFYFNESFSLKMRSN